MTFFSAMAYSFNRWDDLTLFLFPAGLVAFLLLVALWAFGQGGRLRKWAAGLLAFQCVTIVLDMTPELFSETSIVHGFFLKHLDGWTAVRIGLLLGEPVFPVATALLLVAALRERRGSRA